MDPAATEVINLTRKWFCREVEFTTTDGWKVRGECRDIKIAWGKVRLGICQVGFTKGPTHVETMKWIEADRCKVIE